MQMSSYSEMSDSMSRRDSSVGTHMIGLMTREQREEKVRRHFEKK